MSLYQNRYRIESARLKNWDYSSNGNYFVTMCTKYRKHLFGEIINGEMLLSEIGKIAYKYWQEIPNHFLFIRLDNFVIMPDHIHGIIKIIKQDSKTSNLGVVINQYKRKCTIQSRKIDPAFRWLPRYHDHVIQNNGDLNRIRDYIQNNPRNWKRTTCRAG